MLSNSQTIYMIVSITASLAYFTLHITNFNYNNN